MTVKSICPIFNYGHMPTRCQQEVDVARPAKPRFVTEEPCVDFFKPRGIPLRELEEERLSVEELEALKLADIELSLIHI